MDSNPGAQPKLGSGLNPSEETDLDPIKICFFFNWIGIVPYTTHFLGILYPNYGAKSGSSIEKSDPGPRSINNRIRIMRRIVPDSEIEIWPDLDPDPV